MQMSKCAKLQWLLMEPQVSGERVMGKKTSDFLINCEESSRGNRQDARLEVNGHVASVWVPSSCSLKDDKDPGTVPRGMSSTSSSRSPAGLSWSRMKLLNISRWWKQSPDHGALRSRALHGGLGSLRSPPSFLIVILLWGLFLFFSFYYF